MADMEERVGKEQRGRSTSYVGALSNADHGGILPFEEPLVVISRARVKFTKRASHLALSRAAEVL